MSDSDPQTPFGTFPLGGYHNAAIPFPSTSPNSAPSRSDVPSQETYTPAHESTATTAGTSSSTASTSTTDLTTLAGPPLTVSLQMDSDTIRHTTPCHTFWHSEQALSSSSSLPCIPSISSPVSIPEGSSHSVGNTQAQMEGATKITISDLPSEILEMICQRLSQTTLRRSARLVSRQWHAVCTRCIYRTAVWEPLSEEDDQRLLKALQNRGDGEEKGVWARTPISSLECNIYCDDSGDSQHHGPETKKDIANAWNCFLEALLSTPYEAPQDDMGHEQDLRVDDQGNRDCVMDRLQRLRLLCSKFAPIRVGIHRALVGSHFESLQSLEIYIAEETRRNLGFFIILDNSPALRNVWISGPRAGGVDLVPASDNEEDDVKMPWSGRPYFSPKRSRLLAARSAIHRAALQQQHQPQPQELQEPQRQYKLKFLVLTNVNARQEDLERIASTCPHLQIFHAIRFFPGLRTKPIAFRLGEEAVLQLHARESLLERDRVLHHFKDSCPQLRSCEVITISKGRGPTYARHLQRHSLIFPDFKSVTLCSAPSGEGRWYGEWMDDSDEDGDETYDSDEEDDEMDGSDDDNGVYDSDEEEEAVYSGGTPWPLQDESGFRTVGFLSRLTTLEIRHTSLRDSYSLFLNHLLCLTPSLLHCRASEEEFRASLVIPATTTTEAMTSVAATALPTIQVPQIWQCRLLRTLDLRVSGNYSRTQTSELSLIGAYFQTHGVFQS